MYSSSKLHQRASGDELIEQLRQLTPQRCAVLGEILHQEVGKHFGRGLNADVDAGLTGEFSNQEYQCNTSATSDDHPANHCPAWR